MITYCTLIFYIIKYLIKLFIGAIINIIILCLEILNMKKFLCIAIPIFLLICLSAVFNKLDGDDNNGSSSSKEPPSRYEIVGQIEMTSLYNQSLGYTVNIKGKLKNTTDKEFSYVMVTFAIYDKSGGQIAIATDSMTYVQAGSFWSFNAKLYDYLKVYPKSCKLIRVTAY